MANDISYIKAGYKKEKWKWVLDLPEKDELLLNPNIIKEKLSNEYLLRTYDLDKYPKSLPCLKKCKNNPWCLSDVPLGNKSKNISLTKQPKDPTCPIGLQNTANTCWINSALQSLFHLQHFRNCVNSIHGFKGEESLSSFIYLLQAVFQEIDSHKNKALECHSGSVFEKLAIFATEKVMQKDQDNEVLKCVSEFIENTIDFLLGDPATGPTFYPLFHTSLYRISRWKCTSCQRDHVSQLSPVTTYIMAAYVTSDECPLDQCLLDLQTETQTGVSLVCGQDGEGCGASVKVDRVVTPKILSLPSYLIIRNNSLVDRDAKRRLHVVYPETLDLSQHACGSDDATYSLRAVIYHHGYWIKHFSAHVKTEDGKWFNFNDEKVTGLASQNGSGVPTETNKNYFSFGAVASKYKNQRKVRVSRGAFIWIYEKVASNSQIDLPPPDEVTDYVASMHTTDEIDDELLLKEAKQTRRKLMSQLYVTSENDEVHVISRSLLSNWLSSTNLRFQPDPSLLASGLCEHKKLDSFCSKNIKCIKADMVEKLVKDEFGIHSSGPISMRLSEAMCIECISRDVHHILYRENLRLVSKQVKQEATKTNDSERKPIGQESLKLWPLLALNLYMKDKGFFDMKPNVLIEEEPIVKENEKISTEEPWDSHPGSSNNFLAHENGFSKSKHECTTNGSSDSNGQSQSNSDCKDDKYIALLEEKTQISDETMVKAPSPVEVAETNKLGKNTDEEVSKTGSEEVPDDQRECEINNSLTLFNQEIVCPHNKMDPIVPVMWLPPATITKIENFCQKMVHPAISMKDFTICTICEKSMTESAETCVQGKQERKLLHNLFTGKKRPSASRGDTNKFLLVNKSFITDWRSFVKLCERDNFDLERPTMIDNSDFICCHDLVKYSFSNDQPITDLVTLVYEEEWKILNDFYLSTHTIEASFDDVGNIVTSLGLCEGCAATQSALMIEEQFQFEWGTIYIRQVNSVSDVPSTQNGVSESELELPRKRQKIDISSDKSMSRAANQRLVRASKEFSCNDTIKQVQNFIAEKTGIWPILQTMWLRGGGEQGPEPLLLTDNHRTMTLRSLRVKEGDTIYFKAAIEDMEKAAGDGVTEFNDPEDL